MNVADRATRSCVLATLAVATLAAGASWSCVPSKAHAQRENMITGARPEVHGNLGWHGDLGAGGGVDIPVAREGFIDGTDDEFALRPGGEVFFLDFDGGHDVGAAALLAAQWNFYVSHDWSLFPELGPALEFGQHHHAGGHDHGVHLYLFLNLGARYHFNARNAFLMRLSWPYGLQLGVTF